MNVFLALNLFTSMEFNELAQGYNAQALSQIIEKAKESVELEYGKIIIPEAVQEKLIRQCKNLVKNYNSIVAYDEMKRELIKFIKRL